MDVKRVFRIVGLLFVVGTLVLAACNKGGEATSTTPSANADQPTAETSQSSEGAEEGATAAPAPTATLTAQEQFPETLVIHPEAFDFEASTVTNTYVYYVPLLVQETVDYLIPELEALGWTELGKPTVMGHLATLVMQQGKQRLTVSMQDNERSASTRIQMQLMQ